MGKSKNIRTLGPPQKQNEGYYFLDGTRVHIMYFNMDGMGGQLEATNGMELTSFRIRIVGLDSRVPLLTPSLHLIES